MIVRYIQESECRHQCGTYYSPEIDAEVNIEHELDETEMHQFALGVLNSWLTDPFGSDDNFHRAMGLIFESEDRQETIFRFTWGFNGVELAGAVEHLGVVSDRPTVVLHKNSV